MLKELIEFLKNENFFGMPTVVRNTTQDRLIEDPPKISKPKHEVYKDTAKQWRWRIVAKNGDIIAASCEGYKNKVDAEKNLRYITNLRIGQ